MTVDFYNLMEWKLDSTANFLLTIWLFKLLNVYPFDYAAFVVCGKVGYPETGLTTPVGWLLLLLLTVLSQSAIIV